MTVTGITLSWGMLAAAAILNVLGLYAVKTKLDVLGALPVTSVSATIDYLFAFARSPWALASVACILAAPLPHAVAISRMPLSLAYPASVALNCVLLVPRSILFFGEPLTAEWRASRFSW